MNPDTSETALIVASRRDLPTFELNTSLKIAKSQALERAALIGDKLPDADSKIIAVRAQVELKSILATIEKGRKAAKEPLLQAGRNLDNLCATESLELDKEYGRVTQAVSEFDLAERRRVAEEERLQREELARIEREKQAEIDRINRELALKAAEAIRVQNEIDRKLREEAEVAAKLAAEATNKKQREAAELARQESLKRQAAAEVERQKQQTILEEQAKAAQAAKVAIEEQAGDAALCAAKPIEAGRVAGQRQTSDWEITKMNEWVLAKARPDLVRKIEFDIRAIKECLSRGEKLAGIEAKEVFTSNVKVQPMRKAINV